MIFFRNGSGPQWTVALAVLVLCICSSKINPCWGEDNNENENENGFHPSSRADRFPSVEERVKIYMSNWYTPPCEGDEDAFVRYQLEDEPETDSEDDGYVWQTLNVEGYRNHPIVNQTTRILENIQSIITPDKLFFMDQETIFNCGNYSYDEEWGNATQDPYMDRIVFRQNMRMYCEDIQKLLVPAWRHLRLLERGAAKFHPPPPTLFQFGDLKHSHDFGLVNLPHIKKFRSAAASPQDLLAVTDSETCYSSTATLRTALESAHGNSVFQPIVWKLASHRHFKKLGDVYRYDSQWSKKKDMAVFMGQLTGINGGYDKHLSDMENCQNLQRCRLVYNHANSTLVYARLTNTRERLPAVLNGVELLGGKVRLDELLNYKGLIMMEGNDVASGLKWALLSQSIVLMPIPKHTSWCMEELLEPWVHYVPLDEFASDVEEKMQWVIDNDAQARRISERATLWMEDMVFHPDAPEDDRMIQEEILRRYEAHFLKSQHVHY